MAELQETFVLEDAEDEEPGEVQTLKSVCATQDFSVNAGWANGGCVRRELDHKLLPCPKKVGI